MAENLPRISWNEFFMDTVISLARRSTCYKKKTAAVIVNSSNQIISMGYNGVPSGAKHCSEVCVPSSEHYLWSINNEIHGEMNAILHSSDKLEGTTMYTLLSPCIHCAKAIHSVGISKIFYLCEYKRDLQGIEFLKKYGISIEKLKN